ncbi:MAG: tetratricopeptide repeat protein, partial [Candidatus Obscuribacter sp.]|nr:tetratricopeptide repeat protein [Candidatus Obscuribacter sp.]
MEDLQNQARVHAGQAVDIKVRLVGAEHGYVENAWRTKGQVLYALGYYPEAQEAFSKALALAEKLKIPDAEASRCRSIALCLEAQGKFDEAKSYYE